MTMVAFLTRLSNYVVNNDTAFPFDTARVMDTSYCTWAGTGNPIVIVTEGWYWVGVNATTLGTYYGGANNSDWVTAVGRNGVDLAHTVISERHYHSSAASADLMSIGAPVYLYVADEIDVYFQNPNASTLLVESNPSDGLPSGYLTDAGPGTIGTHLFLIAMAGIAP